MGVSRYWVVFLVVSIAIVLLSCTSSSAAQSPPPESSTAGTVAQTKNLINGTIVVPAGGSHDVHIETDVGTMSNVRIVGWFHASGGSQSEIEVFLASDSDYQTWTEGRSIKPLYNSGRTTFANINVGVPVSYETYHLVFNNIFSTSLKTIQAEIELDYYVPAPTPTTTSTP